MRIAGFRPHRAIGRTPAQAAPSTAFAAGCNSAQILAQILAPYGLMVHDDGSSSSFTLANRTGHQVMVNTLGDLWEAAERIVGRPGRSRLTPASSARRERLDELDPREGRMRLTILGGFLGAGKSTWLRHHLHHGLLRDALGGGQQKAADAPVDDALLVGSARLRVLTGGCACCETRPALMALLRNICDDRVRREASARRTDRIVLQKPSGLVADPGRIAHSIVTDPVLQHHIVVGEIIVTVDALHGLEQIRDEDLGRPAARSRPPTASWSPKWTPRTPSTCAASLRPFAFSIRARPCQGSVMGSPIDLPDAFGSDPETLPRRRLDGGGAPIRAAALDLGKTLGSRRSAVWLSALIHARGDDVLRIKGVLGLPRGRLLLQSVRKVVQSPGDTARRTRGRRQSGWLACPDRAAGSRLAKRLRSLNAFGIGGVAAIEAGAASANARRPSHGDG